MCSLGCGPLGHSTLSPTRKLSRPALSDLDASFLCTVHCSTYRITPFILWVLVYLSLFPLLQRSGSLSTGAFVLSLCPQHLLLCLVHNDCSRFCWIKLQPVVTSPSSKLSIYHPQKSGNCLWAHSLLTQIILSYICFISPTKLKFLKR